ncbi:Tigger transposable element-derived protein 4 [Araneus ventricosus]|uniref:Tigger transposable element-derived protein 4 n=1 Tax=Araneus ventricosus TaxID=182803 RepID=A0A4Y2EW84_ARAVE|nr:Tigger transposable element-derived protein 4 [Araneus ventricosus]
MAPKRKSLSVKEKFCLIKDIESGMKNKDVAKKYEISTSTVSTILKNRDSVFKTFESVGGDRKRSKSLKFDKIDEAVLEWVKMIRDEDIPVSRSLIKDKATEYAANLGISNFQASSGWIDKFKKRHGFQEKVISFLGISLILKN